MSGQEQSTSGEQNLRGHTANESSSSSQIGSIFISCLIASLINLILHFVSWQKDFTGEISFILTPPPHCATGFNN